MSFCEWDGQFLNMLNTINKWKTLINCSWRWKVNFELGQSNNCTNDGQAFSRRKGWASLWTSSLTGQLDQTKPNNTQSWKSKFAMCRAYNVADEEIKCLIGTPWNFSYRVVSPWILFPHKKKVGMAKKQDPRGGDAFFLSFLIWCPLDVWDFSAHNPQHKKLC